MRLSVPAALAAAALTLASAGADIRTFEPSHDNTLFESGTGNLSNGAGPNMFAGRNSQGSLRRALVRFDLSDIPDGAIVTSVSLTMFASQTQGGATDVGLHRVLQQWGEAGSSSNGGGGAPAEAGDATWLHTFYDSSLWTTPGGDFVATPSAAQSATDPGFYTWASTPELVADVQQWIGVDGAAESFGWAILGLETSNGTAKRFDTHEHATIANRPVLTVEYIIPGPSGAAAMLLLGAVAARRRR